MTNQRPPTIAVVIPCYRGTSTILPVLAEIGEEVTRIYLVDDACPDRTGSFVEAHCTDLRVRVLRNEKNLGVGGAVIRGYRQALADQVDIVVKVDCDGQMDPAQIPWLVTHLINGEADYTKGCRFYSLEDLKSMPRIRIVGNAVLSIVSKASCGYWSIMDPTNGFTAIHRKVLQRLPLKCLSHGYFFESDMLFRLATIRAVVRDVPMASVYRGEESHLKILRVIREFPPKYLRAFFKRIVYCYFLRDFNGTSLQLVAGLSLILPGTLWGVWHWHRSIQTGIAATAGTVMLAVLPLILGFQFLLSAIQSDMNCQPTEPLQCGPELPRDHRRNAIGSADDAQSAMQHQAAAIHAPAALIRGPVSPTCAAAALDPEAADSGGTSPDGKSAASGLLRSDQNSKPVPSPQLPVAASHPSDISARKTA